MADNSTTSDPSADAPPDTFQLFLDTGSFYLGTCIDGVFYGFFAAAFMVFVAVHRYQGKKFYRGVPNTAIITLFVLCTTYIMTDFWNEYYALTNLFPDRQLNINTAQGVLYSIIDFIGQMTLIYRCWILWNQNFLVVLIPFIFSLVVLASEFTLIALIRSPNVANIIPQLLQLGTGAFSGALVVNFLVMALIISKILIISRGVPRAHRHGDNTYNVVVAMLLESGATVMVGQLLWVVLFRVDNEGGYNVIAGAVTQLYGITATILMIRVAMGASYDSTTKMGTSIIFQPKSQQSRTQVASEEKSQFSTHVVVAV